LYPDGLPITGYYKRFVKDLSNGYKLPIMFFTGCMIANLDYTLGDLINFDNGLFRLLRYIPFIDEDMLIHCLAWSFVQHDNGGSIASIGSTNIVMSSSFNSTGCWNPPLYFASSYSESEFLGEMMTSSINRNIQDILIDDLAAFTIMEHVLLGDPSLKIGGYR